MTEAGALIELQNLDLEILRARKRLEELPEKRAILETRAKQRDVTQLRARADVLLTKLRGELKAHQDEITMLTEKIDAEQKKVMETSDHRAVTSITREMDGLRRRRDKLEMESLQVMERIDKAQGQAGQIDAALEQLAEREAALVERYKSVGGALQSEIANLESKRAAVATSLDSELLARYESLRETKGGVAVGKLEDVTCTACRMVLPVERVSELQSGPDVAVCPQCRRMIVVRIGGEE